MKTIFSLIFLCLLAGSVSAKFAHDGPTPEYTKDFLATMEEIHSEAWESLKPFLDSLDEYVNKSVTAWTKYADEHKSSKAGRKFWSGAKHNMTGEIDSVLSSTHTKIEEMLAAYQAKMEETAASWKGKHAEYDIQAKIGELKSFADDSIVGFKSKMGHSTKSGRKLSGFWDSYSSHKNGTKPSHSGKTYSHSTDYAAKKAEFEAKLAGYKADIDAKVATYKADHAAKSADIKAKFASTKSSIDSKLSTFKADHAAKSADVKSKLADAKASIETKVADFKASRPDFSSKLSHS